MATTNKSRSTEETGEVVETKTAKQAKRQGVDGNYYLINPAGAIHGVDKEHAKWRLKSPGWRLAEEKEIDLYLNSRPHRGLGPVAPRWTSDPDELLAKLD